MTNKYSAIIVDDEELARRVIREYLSQHQIIEVAGESENGFEAARLIGQNKPDLVFLDIQMPKIDGFELLEILDHRPEIIFTTAYDQYAIKAFEQNAVDYLLKPFSKERFDEAADKAILRIRSKAKDKGVSQLIDYNHQNSGKLQRVVVKSGNKIHVIPCGKILFFEAQDDYVLIHTADGKYIKQATMKYFEDKLDPLVFFRTHRSYIVHADEIDRIELYGKESYLVFLKHGQKLPLSKSGYSTLKEKLSF